MIENTAMEWKSFGNVRGLNRMIDDVLYSDVMAPMVTN